MKTLLWIAVLFAAGAAQAQPQVPQPQPQVQVMTMEQAVSIALLRNHDLIAAKLNIASGSDPTPIASTITHADSLLSMFNGKLPYHVRASSAIGQMMLNDANTLDNYNNGKLTPGCSGS